MDKSKILTLKQVSTKVKKLKEEGKKVGLITGCFDVLHIGHLNLFHKAQKVADIVVVGLDNDETISLNKGSFRPINNAKTRLCQVCSLSAVNFVFLIEEKFLFGQNAEDIHARIRAKINPDFLITNSEADKYWKEKKATCKSLNIKFVDFPASPISSSVIIEKLLSEF